MKKFIPFCLIIIALFVIGCSKDDGPVRGDIAIDAVPQPTVVKNG